MGQKIIVKVVFNSSSSREGLESFGNNRYILKLSYPEDDGARAVITEYLSRQMGVPASKIAFQGLDIKKNWLFEVL
jgi:uncharacterized protein YggU (UPF0235/DUF167 family)